MPPARLALFSDFERITFLDVFNMYVVFFVICSQYFVIIRSKMKPLVYETAGYRCTESFDVVETVLQVTPKEHCSVQFAPP